MKRKITQKEIVNILRLHSRYLEGEREGEPADLRDADLTGINMVAAAYEATGKDNVVLTGAHMEGADLSSLSMKGARLDNAYLAGACFCGTFLKGSTFRGADASGADFTKANLMDADFGGALLREAIFSKANLRGMDPSGASFEGAVFSSGTAGLEKLAANGYGNESLLHAILDSDPRLVKALEKACTEYIVSYPEGVKEHMARCRRSIISRLEAEGLLHIDILSGTVICMREKGKTSLDPSFLNVLIPQKDQHTIIITRSRRRGSCRVIEEGKPRSCRRSREEAIADAMEILERRREEGCWQKDTVYWLEHIGDI